jgi:hypothetical protein
VRDLRRKQYKGKMMRGDKGDCGCTLTLTTTSLLIRIKGVGVAAVRLACFLSFQVFERNVLGQRRIQTHSRTRFFPVPFGPLGPAHSILMLVRAAMFSAAFKCMHELRLEVWGVAQPRFSLLILFGTFCIFQYFLDGLWQ